MTWMLERLRARNLRSKDLSGTGAVILDVEGSFTIDYVHPPQVYNATTAQQGDRKQTREELQRFAWMNKAPASLSVMMRNS